MSARPRQVHQLLATLSYGDAIGNEALAIQAHLRRAGFESEIFAETSHPRMTHHAHPLRQYPNVARPDGVCLFHFAVGSAAGPVALQSPGRLAVRYHNITPADYFLGFQNHVVGLCYHGRRGLGAFAPRTELALGVSEFNRRELQAAGFARTAALPIVMDAARPRPRPSRMIRRLYADGRTNLLFVGRIIPNKRIDDLIRVFALYQRHLDPRSRLLLVGDVRGCPHYYDRLQELVADLDLDRVVFAGHVDDDELAAYYGVADLFLCLSEHEGYGVPLLEAMAAGVPVVAYDAGAVAETLRGGGVLLKQKPAEVVAELLDRILSDAALREAILATQARAVDEIRGTDFGALLLDRLAPVLGAGPVR